MNIPRILARHSTAMLHGLIATVAIGWAAPAIAQDTAAEPAQTVIIGLGNVGAASDKAGEYNGLADKGAFAIADVNLRDRTSATSASALRWHVQTHDLGLPSRSAFGDVGQQGTFRLRVGFSELRRYRSDSYETPYDGAGTTSLTLPSNWLLPTVASPSGNSTSARGLIPAIGTAPYLSTSASSQGALLTPTTTQIGTVNAAAAADLPAFHPVNLFTTRTLYDVGLSYQPTTAWGFDARVRPEHKDGVKPMGTVSRNTGADISTVIPDRIDNNHNQVDADLHFTSGHVLGQAGYYGSFFTNHVSSMSWQNWASPTGTMNTMSSAPTNGFQQVSGVLTFKAGRSIRLVTDGSYGRATQNQAFLIDSTTPVVPVTSPNALVVSTLFHAKFTAHPFRNLNVSASYKYDNHDNRTPINIYQYADAGDTPAASTAFPAGPNNPLGAVLAQNANANRPYSRKGNLASADADYAIAPHQWVKLGYDFERLDRSCPGSWISCEDAGQTNEHTGRVDWRAVAGSFTARVGYSRAQRRTPAYNENAFLALVPYANVSPATATGGATALSFMLGNGFNGWGPALGYAATTGNMNVFFPSDNALANTMYANNNRISEIAGLRRYYVSDRNRDRLRSSLAWQLGDSLSMQGGFNLNRDLYPGSTYGLQNAKGWSADGDMLYAPTDFFSADVFYTFERQRGTSAGNSYTANSNTSTITNGQPGAVFLAGNTCDPFNTLQQRNNNNKLDPCLNWSSATLDNVHTVGVDVMKKTGRVTVSGQLTLTRARADDAVTGGNWANNVVNGLGAPATTIAAFFIPATPMPTVTSDTLEARIGAAIPFAGRQSLHLTYVYLRLRSSDWIYEGTTFGVGTITGVLPTNEQPFSYSESVFGVAYVLTF